MSKSRMVEIVLVELGVSHAHDSMHEVLFSPFRMLLICFCDIVSTLDFGIIYFVVCCKAFCRGFSCLSAGNLLRLINILGQGTKLR